MDLVTLGMLSVSRVLSQYRQVLGGLRHQPEGRTGWDKQVGRQENAVGMCVGRKDEKYEALGVIQYIMIFFLTLSYLREVNSDNYSKNIIRYNTLIDGSGVHHWVGR